MATATARKANASPDVKALVSELARLEPFEPRAIEQALRGTITAIRPQQAGAWAGVARLLALALTEKANDTGSSGDDVLPGQKAKSDVVRKTLAREGKLVSAGKLVILLHITRQALSRAVQTNRLFTVEVEGRRMYPAFFADPKLDRRQVERVAKELNELPGWSKWQFFTTPKASLGGLTPLVALKRGRYSDARRAAIGFAER